LVSVCAEMRRLDGFSACQCDLAVRGELASRFGVAVPLMQAMHPLAMDGVDQNRGGDRDPVGRLAATGVPGTVIFGEAGARACGARAPDT